MELKYDQKKTTEQFKQEAYNLVGDEYIILGNYKNSKTKIKIKHNKCGTTYEARPADFLKGSRCPNCYGTPKKTTQEFLKEVYGLVGDDYTFLGEYQGNKTKIKVKHNICGNVYRVIPNAFLRGNRCPYCYGKLKKNTEQFKQEVYDQVGGEYTVLSKYEDYHTKILMRHNKCNQDYEVTPNNFLYGYRCPYCANDYKGENTIKSYLDEYSIDYEQHKHFEWLVYDNPQHLDFYLPDYNLAIEYDGEQHFQTVRRSKKEAKQELENRLKLNQLRDKNKDKLLKEHSIKLLRIPYWKRDNIEKILNKVLTKQK